MTYEHYNEMMAAGERARQAARLLARMSSVKKNKCLKAMADELCDNREKVLSANAQDMADGRKSGLSSAILDRLELTPERIVEMAKGIRALTGLSDPVGKVLSTWLRPNGLKIEKVSVPIGVIAIIYESRPNVTVDAAALCLKAGNTVLLRGGSAAFHSNNVLAELMCRGGARSGLPEGAVQIVPWRDHEAVKCLLHMDQHVDLVIPRGGEGLIRAVVEESRIPVIKHYKGVCHVYVDQDADLDMALTIVENAKCQRAGVCNAAETVLVHRAVSDEFLPRAALVLRAAGVELRGDSEVCRLVPEAAPASEEDWYEEYLDMILSLRVVDDAGQAVDHIVKYGSAHSDAIVTENRKTADQFTESVDSAVVFVNASTRFTDGGQFGMGAEIGISTDRIHARGPMGVEELNTYKYVVRGKGQIRE